MYPAHEKAYYYNDALNAAVGMGDLWDTLNKIATKTSDIAGKVASVVPVARDVYSGDRAIAVVPTNQTSTVLAGKGPLAFGIPGMPSWVIPVGLGAVALLLLRRR